MNIIIAMLLALQQDQPGPWNGDAALLESTDGLRFRKVRTLVEGAGVPTLIADARGRLIALFQWFPKNDEKSFDRVAVCFSEDQGTSWTPPKPIVMKQFPESLIRPFDPTIVLLEDGRFRLYYTSRERQGIPAIYSAVSEDAITWTYEPGVRFGVEGEFVIDCAAVRIGREWHLYSPVQRKDGVGYHAVSSDGLKFERRKNVEVAARGSWLGCAVNLGSEVRFYGSGLMATSRDGETWSALEAKSGTDPGVAKIGDRWFMLSTEVRRVVEPKIEPETVVAHGDHLFVLRGDRLTKIDPRTGNTVGELRIVSERRSDYLDHMRKLDSTGAPKYTNKVQETPKTVKVGPPVVVGQGGFPRPIWIGGKLWVFLSNRDRAWVRRMEDGVEKDLKPEDAHWVDHDLTYDTDHVYHYVMLPGCAGLIRKYDKDFKLVAETRPFRAAGNEMILDQNIAVFDGKVYAAGEYRERGPWPMELQNFPPDAKAARGVHLRIFDLELKLLEERNLTATIEGAAVKNQFWGLGTSQVKAGKYHCLVVHTPVGNVAKFSKGESIGARGIFVLRYDEQFRFVDAKGPLSDTNRDNFWCTGAWYDSGKYYVIYSSLGRGYYPGPGEAPELETSADIRLGIYDEAFEEIETIELARGGMWPDVIKVGDRLYAAYVSERDHGAVLREILPK